MESKVPMTTEQLQHKLEVWKAELAYAASQNGEMLKAVLETGQTALKSAILINGGAAAALLALFADWLKSEPTNQTAQLLSPLGQAWLLFMWGLGTAGAATAARYLSQALYAGEVDCKDSAFQKVFHRGAQAFVAIAIALGASSFLLFFVATHRVYSAIGESAKYTITKQIKALDVQPAMAPAVLPATAASGVK